MKLRELAAHFTKYLDNEQSGNTGCLYVPVGTFNESDGIRFQCPKCVAAGGDTFKHPIFIGFSGKATPGTYGYNKAGQPVLWNVAGSTLDDLSLTPSIQIQGGCDWHGFVGSNGVPPGEAA